MSGRRGDRLPILNLDFDGVIHDYGKGWQNGRIYGAVTEGFFAWATEAAKNFTLIIHTSRAKDMAGSQAVMQWLITEGERTGFPGVAGLFDVTATKPPAMLTIDDRCVRFDGDWGDPKLDPIELRNFKPWMNWSAT